MNKRQKPKTNTPAGKPNKSGSKRKETKNVAVKKSSEKPKPKNEKPELDISPKKRYFKHTPPKRKERTPISIENKDSISINKYISDTGFCSRREADNYIAQGRVSINGNVALKGNRVLPDDAVEVDGSYL